MKTSIPFGILLIGLIIVYAAGSVGARVLFRSQPGIENVFSIIWAVVLAVVLYRLLLYIRPSKDGAQKAWRQNVVGGLVFLCELFSVVVLIFCAIMLSSTLTATTSQSGLTLLIGVVALCALSIPVGIRIIRMVNRRLDLTRSASDLR